ncbi:MAG: cytochrome c1 [Pseudomonadota bacterium]
MTNPLNKLIVSTFAALAAVACSVVGGALAAGGAVEHPKHLHWHFDGPFGEFDKEAVQRGYQVYSTVCASCHSMDLLAFRNLGQKGGPLYLEECPAGFPSNLDCSNPNDNPIVKAIAAQFQVEDGPDDSGDMFMRPALPADRFVGPYANEQQARVANNGAMPPDLSLIVKARHGGANYIYSLLTGYAEAPETVTIAPGQYYNPYFHGDMATNMKEGTLDEEGHPLEGIKIPVGGVLAMAPPLSDGMIEYASADVPQTVDQYARDVTEFLAWAAEPKMEARKSLGRMTVIYLLILSGIVYWSYREIWSDQH